ncbi:MAG: YfhO family protein, partial [Bacteroidales bacterium]|nr:YfhO family protein [Bacteroidales bacterium]
MAFTEFCFKVLPLYNKFRTVSMSLVVLQLSLPLLGFLTLDQVARGKVERKTFLTGLICATVLMGGFCLAAWLVPGLFGSFIGAADSQMQGILVEALMMDRIALFKTDALISLILILVSALLLFFADMPGENEKLVKIRRWVAAGVVCILSVANLFVVGRRYLNEDHFTTPKDFGKPFEERPVDQLIKADTDPQYRVLDLTVDIFNSSLPSYHHKNVGGYSPAKLQRYQDLIEHYLANEINGLYKQLDEVENLEGLSDWMATGTPVLNALNTRYLILDGNYPPVVNYSAFGPAWFVDSVVKAANPEEEIALVGAIDLRRQAVVTAPVTLSGSEESDSIEMTSYAPNELHYHYNAATERLAVFSEIYYPNGWHATVDGQPVKLIRADWTLRAALLPAGEHEVLMTFMP